MGRGPGTLQVCRLVAHNPLGSPLFSRMFGWPCGYRVVKVCAKRILQYEHAGMHIIHCDLHLYILVCGRGNGKLPSASERHSACELSILWRCTS